MTNDSASKASVLDSALAKLRSAKANGDPNDYFGAHLNVAECHALTAALSRLSPPSKEAVERLANDRASEATVVQADRDAAAALLLADRMSPDSTAVLREQVISGKADNFHFVQAFTRHRISALSRLSPPSEDVERVAAIVGRVRAFYGFAVDSLEAQALRDVASEAARLSTIRTEPQSRSGQLQTDYDASGDAVAERESILEIVEAEQGESPGCDHDHPDTFNVGWNAAVSFITQAIRSRPTPQSRDCSEIADRPQPSDAGLVEALREILTIDGHYCDNCHSDEIGRASRIARQALSSIGVSPDQGLSGVAAGQPCHSAEPEPASGLGPSGECQAQGGGHGA